MRQSVNSMESNLKVVTLRCPLRRNATKEVAAEEAVVDVTLVVEAAIEIMVEEAEEAIAGSIRSSSF